MNQIEIRRLATTVGVQTALAFEEWLRDPKGIALELMVRSPGGGFVRVSVSPEEGRFWDTLKDVLKATRSS